MNELATLHYGFSAPRTLEETKAQYRLLEEWLILMTNSEHGLDWPEITLKNKRLRYNLYFWRERNPAPAPGMGECFPPFALVREQLGQLFMAWRDKREEYGPPFALYVASRRGFRLYTENRFTNFAVAMESFHTTKNPASVQTTKLDAKIQEILGQVEKKHKHWLAYQLKKSREPNLEHRILGIITSLQLDLKEDGCIEFAKSCADRRNDIMHYGGRRDKSITYDEFHDDIARKSEALSYLLHVLILQELGIAADITHRFVYQSYLSINIKHAFVAVGLLDKSVLGFPYDDAQPSCKG